MNLKLLLILRAALLFFFYCFGGFLNSHCQVKTDFMFLLLQNGKVEVVLYDDSCFPIQKSGVLIVVSKADLSLKRVKVVPNMKNPFTTNISFKDNRLFSISLSRVGGGCKNPVSTTFYFIENLPFQMKFLEIKCDDYSTHYRSANVIEVGKSPW